VAERLQTFYACFGPDLAALPYIMYPTSGFVDNVIFHIWRAFLSKEQHYKNNSLDVNQILLTEKSQQIFVVSCAPGTKFAIYHFLVYYRG